MFEEKCIFKKIHFMKFIYELVSRQSYSSAFTLFSKQNYTDTVYQYLQKILLNQYEISTVLEYTW